MPQRASQRKFGNYTWLNKRNRGNWCMKKRKVYRERERLFWRSAKRNHQGEREQSCRYVSGCVCIRSISQKQETRGWESLTKPGVPREQVQRSRRENKGAPKNSSSFSSLAAYPTSSPSYSRPVRCCPPQLANWNREPGHAWPRREPVPNSPGAGRKLQPGPGCDCCHSYHAEGCRVAPPYES